MSGLAEHNTGSGAVRDAHRFDEGALACWMRQHVDASAGELVVEQFKGGQSNPTFKLVTPRRSYVMRRKPPGPLLKGAHAIEREARVLAALERASFPVPHVHGLCTDDAVIGTWFYVMDLVEGRIFWDAALPEVPRRERLDYIDALNRTLAALHAVDYKAIGLADYGRPGNYFQRQIERWSKQYLADSEAGRDPLMDRLVAWLPTAIPPGDETAIIHGDYRLDNVIFHPQEARIVAVLDWELSTLGHPLADFAYSVMMYRMPPEIVPGLAGADLAQLNIPDEADYVEAYCRRTGRRRIEHLDFYIAFNFFRLAAVFHGIKGRVLRGTAASAQAHQRVEVLPELIALAAEQARRAGMQGEGV